MATQRFISTSFWDDEWIQTLDPSEKLLYLYLMTNPLTTIAGIYEITVRRICFDTGFNSDTVKHILGKFEKARKAFHHNGFMVIPAWPQHQKADSRPKIKEGIDAILKKLSPDMIDYIISVSYRYDIGSYRYVRNYSDSDSDSDSESDTEREGAPAMPSRDPAPFEKMLYAWYQKFFEATCLTIQPSEEDRKAAAEAMKQLGNDEDVGLRAVDYYWKHWQDLWFAYKSSDRQKPPAQRKADYSFRGFARNITSCLVTEKVMEAVDDPF